MRPNVLLGMRPIATKPAVPAASTGGILDAYVTSYPDPQNALDIFEGEWSGSMPEPLAHCKAGGIPLSADSRIRWWLDEQGSIEGKSVLELGPLEAGHTHMLHQAGAGEIVAIESNTRAYLKCLVVKELLKLERAQFLCGDFNQWLRAETRPFELVLASGVLYHMQDPVELIFQLARHCSGSMMLWSHYYDHEIIQGNPGLAPKFPTSSQAETAGYRHTLFRQEYQGSLGWTGFCGGSAPISAWLSREELFGALRHFGFGNFRISFDDPNHPHGPALALIADRMD